MGFHAMKLISVAVLLQMLQYLEVQELRDVYGLVALELPWVVVELAIHAMIIRRLTTQEESFFNLSCVEFFAGNVSSSQIAKAFSELGLQSYAFDISRYLAEIAGWLSSWG